MKISENETIEQIFEQVGVGHPLFVDYSICFRKELGFCSQTYSVIEDNETQIIDKSENSTIPSFSILNMDDTGTNFTTIKGRAGAGMGKCPYNFLLLNGMRFCGHNLNGGQYEEMPDYSSPETDDRHVFINIHIFMHVY